MYKTTHSKGNSKVATGRKNTAARKCARPYSRHGLNALKTRVMVKGLHAIDKRTAAAQALIAWRSELLTDLGGEGNVSAQRLALIDLATRTRLYVDSLDAWIMEQDSLVNRRKKSVLPILRERQQLADSLARILGQLGLERLSKPVKSLADHIEEKYGASLPEHGRSLPSGDTSRQATKQAGGAARTARPQPYGRLNEI